MSAGNKIVVNDNFGCQQLLKDIMPNVHMIDIRVRMDGEYYWFDGNYLKGIIQHVEYHQVNNDGIVCDLESHKQMDSNNVVDAESGGGRGLTYDIW